MDVGGDCVVGVVDFIEYFLIGYVMFGVGGVGCLVVGFGCGFGECVWSGGGRCGSVGVCVGGGFCVVLVGKLIVIGVVLIDC